MAEKKRQPQRLHLPSDEGARASDDMLAARDKRMGSFLRAAADDPNCAVLGDPPPEFSALAKSQEKPAPVSISAVGDHSFEYGTVSHAAGAISVRRYG
jgi:hypothetical protein